MTSTLNALLLDVASLQGAARALQEKCQGFFELYAATVIKPSIGSEQKDFIVALLARAKEAGLYEPPQTEPKK